MLIDSHCHLDAAEFAADRAAVVARAQAAGVRMIVVPAVERANFDAVTRVCGDYAGCHAAYGIHPLFVGRARQTDLDELKAVLQAVGAVAVGEIGLDFFVPERDEALQQFYFAEQLQLARALDLPVLLHVRRAVDAVLAQLRRLRVRGGIAHAFNGSRQQAEEFIKLGFKLGFGGAMTHPRATRLRELAATLPLDALVLETDAPDIPPEWLGRGRNEPGELARIAAEMARLRQMPVDELLSAIHANTRAALPILPG